MATTYWIRLFVIVLAIAFVTISGAQLLRGHPLEEAVLHGLLWSVISATIFTGVRLYKFRRGQYCAMCGDAPPAADSDRPG